MKKVVLLLCSVMLSASMAFADTCFIAKKKDQMIHKEGDCDKRYSPCSTFKIVLSLMGFDAGILKDGVNPQWPFKPEYEAFLESWKDPQNPTSWMKNSCVWYSQVLTSQLGMGKFQDYVGKFNYGNMDLSGEFDADNGLTHSWLSSSLEISSSEQVAFLKNMLEEKLPIQPYAVAMTKHILFVEELKNGWKLYGKTGMGSLLDKDRKKLDVKHGWFIGWIEKDDKKIIFANHIADDKKEETFPSLRAKADAKEKLINIIDEMEWKVGAKIHFEEESTPNYTGIKEVNKEAKRILNKILKISKDKCDKTAKILLKKDENNEIIIDHYSEKMNPFVGEEMHATLLYTTERGFCKSETLKQVCPVLFGDCKNPIDIHVLSKKYQAIIQQDWLFKISDINVYKNEKSITFSAKLLVNDKENIEIEGNSVSAGLHLTLIQCFDPSILNEDTINQVLKDLKESFKGKFIKIASKNGGADLEFGLSRQPWRIRAGQKIELTTKDLKND